MIEFKNVNKIYVRQNTPFHALRQINFIVQKKEIFGIIGKSGAGKSTLLRCANGLEHPSEGAVHINGQCLTTFSAQALRAARRKIGMIFQHFNLLQSRNVFDNIALPLELEGLPPIKIKARVNTLLQLTDLEAQAKQYPHQLSGGQKQRVAIARALANEPNILLCDEATSALDPNSTQVILQLLKKINIEFGITILLITHEMEVIKTICDKVAVIADGQIVETQNAIGLFLNPQTQQAKALVKKSLNIPDRSLHDGTLVRIAYQGEVTSKPIIASLIKDYGVTVNILQGHIETIQNQIVGEMIVEITGSSDSITQSLNFLKENNLSIEIINHDK